MKAGYQDQGYKIGPLFANNYRTADAFYRACLNAVPNEKIYLDIPVNFPETVKLIKSYDATYVFECARMYYGKPPASDMKRVYGITSFELG